MRPILAVDPGLTTGWASWHPYADSSPSRHAGQLKDVLGFMRWSRKFIMNGPGVVVCEDFIPRGTAVSWQPASLHIIGWLMAQADYSGWEFRLQTPAQAKGFATNEKLKRAGWWVPGQDHARDALRHLMFHLCVTEGDQDLLRLVAP